MYQAVDYVVQWGLQHRSIDAVRAIGVDEIQYGRGHQYLTLVYQIEAGCQRLLWVGKERTRASFQQFFTFMGKERNERIEFVCSDMWKPYLELIKKHCTHALNILDRFHVVAKMNLAFDEVRAGDARRMVREGYEPLLKRSRWCLLKRPENLTDLQRVKLRALGAAAPSVSLTGLHWPARASSMRTSSSAARATRRWPLRGSSIAATACPRRFVISIAMRATL